MSYQLKNEVSQANFNNHKRMRIAFSEEKRARANMILVTRIYLLNLQTVLIIIRNNTQTAVKNMKKNPMLENKII